MKKIITATLLLVITSTSIVYYIYNREVSRTIEVKKPTEKKEYINQPKQTEKYNLREIKSIKEIFNNKDVTSNKTITLIATGDYIPARSVNFQASKYGYKWPFGNTIDLLSNGDITLTNMESPLVKNCPLTNEGFKFCGSLKHIEGINSAGIDIINLANNHSGNYGKDGLEQTINILHKNNIQTTGIKNLKGCHSERSEESSLNSKSCNIKYETRGNTTLAFLGYDIVGPKHPNVSWANKENIKKEVSQASNNADIVVVSFSWGTEYITEVTNRQKELAHLAVENGANLIIGNHSHWIQPVEVYKGKVIMYAHGNFIFDQEWSQKTKEGVVGKYTFYKDELVNVEFTPIYITSYGQVNLAKPQKANKILNNLKDISIEYHNENNLSN